MLDLALDLRRGSFHLQVAVQFAAPWTVLFGPSGAGKTTLLRCLAGLDPVPRGTDRECRIALDGDILADRKTGRWVPAGRRRIGLVTQQPALFPHLSVADNVAYGIAELDRPTRSKRVAEMLELVNAGPLLHRRPQGLSGGEAQRIALARALAPLPRLLLLDEPFSALDGASSDRMIQRLRDYLGQRAIPAILVTHDVAEALAGETEIARIEDGRLAALGPAAKVLQAERERLLARLHRSHATADAD